MAFAGRRRVAQQFGVDERTLRPVGVDPAAGRQRGDDPPAQVGVDPQSVQTALGRVTVEQVGQQCQMLGRQLEVHSALTKANW